MIQSLEGWPTKANEAPSPHEVRPAPLDTNPVLQNLGEEHECNQVNSPESGNARNHGNFTKVTKYLTKLKDTLINYV